MTRQRYVLISIATAIAVIGMTMAQVGSAQTTGPLSCTTNTPTVTANQTAVFTAMGGNGSYTWSGDNLNVTNPTGSQFSVSYPATGTYTIHVMSGGQFAGCALTVVSGAAPSNNGLACTPASQTVSLGQTAHVSASGGDGTYTWSAPGLTINNPYGTGFDANFATGGVKTITVSSGNSTASCLVNVLVNSGTPSTPGLPNTGGGYGHWGS